MTANRANTFASRLLLPVCAKETNAFNSPRNEFNAVFASAVSDVFNDSPTLGVVRVLLFGAVLIQHLKN